MPRVAAGVLTALALLSLSLAGAAVAPDAPGDVHWADWTSGSWGNGYTATGTITTTNATVTVTYHNPQGIAFAQYEGGTDYWTNGCCARNAATSPYTSEEVPNIPTGADIIALRYAGHQTLTFSQPIAHPVFSYVSLNGNGYAFDRDFEILSFGDASDGNDCGYWGCGTSYKQVVDLGDGTFEYRLLGTGEPHGTLRFLGAFSSVTWRSLTSEYWNGFTVGVAGTVEEVFCDGVNEPIGVDTDGDGTDDACDLDDDGDCYSDQTELAGGSDPLDPTSIPTLAGPVQLPFAVTSEGEDGLCVPHELPSLG